MFRGVGDQLFRKLILAEVPERLLVGIRADERRSQSQELHGLHDAHLLRILLVINRESRVLEIFHKGTGKLEFQFQFGIAAAGELFRFVDFLLQIFQIRQHEFGQNQFEIAGGIDLLLDMHHIRILEQADNVRHGIHIADMTEELVAEPLPLARAFDKSGDVDKLHCRGDDLRGMFQLDQIIHALVGNRYDSRIRINRAERKIGGYRPAFAQRIEKGRLPDIRQSYKTTGKSHW